MKLGENFKTSTETLTISIRDLQEGKEGGTIESFGIYTNSAFDASSSNVTARGSSNFTVVDETNKTSAILENVKLFLIWITRKAKSVCSLKMVRKRVPLLSWLPKYDKSSAIGDFIAGITVGLTLIPQALAYSNVAGVPVQYGLYGSFLGCFIYILFGSCKDVPFGPSAIMSLLTFQAIKGRGPEQAILLCFITGMVQVLMGIFGIGFVVDFISGPVSSGFTSAVALIIVTSQVKDILGISATGNTFISTWNSIFHNIHDTQMADAVLGFTCIIILLSIKIGIANRFSTTHEQEGSTLRTIMNKSIWLFGTARNAILVIICGIIGYVFSLNGTPPFKVIGPVPQGLPELKLPPFGYEEIRNGTVVHHNFLEMVTNLGNGLIVLPLIGLLENIAVCKAFGNGKPVDATQELLAIGLCNVANSFVQAFPCTGALARGAINNASGVRTPLGGLYTGLLVITSLLFFTPFFFYIPKAALAGVIVSAVVFMVEIKVIRPMWRSKKSCFMVFCITFLACLIAPLEIGILVGIGINLILILYHAARPKITVEKLTTNKGVDYLMLTPDRCLMFPSVDYVRNLVTKQGMRQGIPVIIDCSHIYSADYTAARVIESLIHDFSAKNQPLLFYNLKPSVYSVFEGLSPKDFIVFYNGNEIDELLKKWPHPEKDVGNKI